MIQVLLQTPLITNTGFGTLPVGISDFVLLGVKTLFIIGALLYLVFAFVVTRQIQVMRSTVITPFSPAVQLLGLVHLVLALAVLILFITVL